MKCLKLLASAMVIAGLAASTLTPQAEARHRDRDYQNYLNQVAMQRLYNQRLSQQYHTQLQQQIYYQNLANQQASMAARYGGYGGYGSYYPLGGRMNHRGGWR